MRSTPSRPSEHYNKGSAAGPGSTSERSGGRVSNPPHFSNRARASFEALGRSLTGGKGEGTFRSYVNARRDSASEEIEFDDVQTTRGHGEIQVVTVVEQDVEKIGGQHQQQQPRSSTNSVERLVRPTFYESDSHSS